MKHPNMLTNVGFGLLIAVAVVIHPFCCMAQWIQESRPRFRKLAKDAAWGLLWIIALSVLGLVHTIRFAKVVIKSANAKTRSIIAWPQALIAHRKAKVV